MVASLDNLSNASVYKNDTVEKLVIANKTLTDSIASLQAYKLNIIKLVEKLTSCTPSVSNPSTADKPPWDLTGYFWPHRYKVNTGHSSATCTTRKPVHDITEKRGDIKEGATWNER